MIGIVHSRSDCSVPTNTLFMCNVQLFAMSLLACLGHDAEPIRDVYLARLQAATEVLYVYWRLVTLAEGQVLLKLTSHHQCSLCDMVVCELT